MGKDKIANKDKLTLNDGRSHIHVKQKKNTTGRDAWMLEEDVILK